MTDNMDFNTPKGDDPFDNAADLWGLEDIQDSDALLFEDNDPDIENEAPVESRSARREREEREERERRRAAKRSKKAAKAVNAETDVPEEDPFWNLSAKAKSIEEDPEEEPEGGDGEKKKKAPRAKKAKKEKAPKTELSPEELAANASSRKRGRITAIVLIVTITLILVGITVGGFVVTNSGVTFPNVYANEIYVGKMTREQVDAALTEHNWDESMDTALRVKLPANVSFKLDSCLSGAKLSRSRAVDAACSYGHSGNWFKNLYLYLLNLVVPTDVDLDDRVIDGAYVKARIAKGVEKFDLATADTGYKIDEENETLVMLKGAGEVKLDESALYSAIEAALLKDEREISFEQFTGTVTMPDFQALHDELAVEPSDAYFTENFEIVKEVDGCWFNVEDAENIWREAKSAEKVSIPLDLTFPEVTEESLSGMLYRDKLGSQTTYFTWSSDNRINNIRLASAKLNGLILMPGEELSYNTTVGQRTEEAGFLPAGAYDDGQVVEEIGGGICQVSSTLYCSTMFAQLETVSRTNHYFKVDYLDYGLDATVSWPNPDFVFRNSREYPVKIVTVCDEEEKSLTIEIWGTDVDGSYVTLRHTSLCVYDPVYVDVCIGYGVSAYRTVYAADGTFMYEIEEPYGIYNFHSENISWPAEKYAADEAAAAEG